MRLTSTNSSPNWTSFDNPQSPKTFADFWLPNRSLLFWSGLSTKNWIIFGQLFCDILLLLLKDYLAHSFSVVYKACITNRHTELTRVGLTYLGSITTRSLCWLWNYWSWTHTAWPQMSGWWWIMERPQMDISFYNLHKNMTETNLTISYASVNYCKNLM